MIPFWRTTHKNIVEVDHYTRNYTNETLHHLLKIFRSWRYPKWNSVLVKWSTVCVFCNVFVWVLFQHDLRVHLSLEHNKLHNLFPCKSCEEMFYPWNGVLVWVWYLVNHEFKTPKILTVFHLTLWLVQWKQSNPKIYWGQWYLLAEEKLEFKSLAGIVVWKHNSCQPIKHIVYFILWKVLCNALHKASLVHINFSMPTFTRRQF